MRITEVGLGIGRKGPERLAREELLTTLVMRVSMGVVEDIDAWLALEMRDRSKGTFQSILICDFFL